MRSVPVVDTRYWLCLSAASIFGTNTGDFVAGYLHIGHLAGLPWLALAFAAIVTAERFAAYRTAIWFWAAIITVRTAATNVGDAFHDFGLGFGVSLPLVLVIFAACVVVYRRAGERPTDGRLRVDGFYWVTMMLAGVLGTIGGDFASFGIHMTTVGAAVVFFALAAWSIRYFKATGVLLAATAYWTTVALIRTAGTAAGDAIAHGIGLVASTVLTGAVFVGLVVCFYRRPESSAAA
jgi:uncharacterized membrane-anchored protein